MTALGVVQESGEIMDGRSLVRVGVGGDRTAGVAGTIMGGV